MKIKLDPASFRDPESRVYISQDHAYRTFSDTAYSALKLFLLSSAYTNLVAKKLILPVESVSTEQLGPARQELPEFHRNAIRQRRIWPVTYPYEWGSDMLADAAECTLDVLEMSVESGFSLKDASAYNVQFLVDECGPRPTFIDLGSIELMPNNKGVWIAYRQFVAHFLLPLFFSRRTQYDFRPVFLTELDGMGPDHAYSLAGIITRLLPPYLLLVTLPRLLRRWENLPSLVPDGARAMSPMERARNVFLLKHTVHSLRRYVHKLRKYTPYSEWLHYNESGIYSQEAQTQKLTFVREFCERWRPRTVLDLGCNVGDYSLVAAQRGATVISIDTDMASLNKLYRLAQSSRATVLPLCVDICNPSPGIGWRNQERPPFLERIGRFDAIFALGLVHHIIGRNGILLPATVELLKSLSQRFLVVELVDPSDPSFDSFLRRRQLDGRGLELQTQELFFSKDFTILQRVPIQGKARILYLMEMRTT